VGVDSPFVGEANWAGGCSWLFSQYVVQPVSYFVHASTAPLAQYSTVWRSRETGVDSRESIVDARYQTIRVPGLLAGLVIRHGIDAISVRCSILRLYESCRTSSAFCVEFEFQKLLRYGPEVLGGMAWHGSFCFYSTGSWRERGRDGAQACSVLSGSSTVVWHYSAHLLLRWGSWGGAGGGKLHPEANPAIFLNLSDAHPIISCPMSISMSYHPMTTQHFSFNSNFQLHRKVVALASPLLSSPLLSCLAPKLPARSPLSGVCPGLASLYGVPRPQ
jgi:phage shock protein PspC (stress-responsive transcriptional regulator)